MESSKNDLTRRGFLTASISGLVGAGLAGFSPSIVLAQENIKQQKTEGKLIYRNLGKTGMKVPVVSMGVMRVEGGPALIQAAYEKGIIHFDSASAYMSGRNEQMVGRTINKLKARDKVIIATKILARQQRQGLEPDILKAKAQSLLRGSLRRLGTDYVDILYVHDIASVDEARQPGLVESMKELKESGKVKAIGISTHSNMAAILNDAAQSGDWDVVLTSFNLTMADDTEMLNALKAASDKGIGIVAMKTLAGGSGWPNLESRRDYNASTITSAALKWVLNNESVHTAIPGFTNFDHINDDYLVALDLNYTDEEKKLLGDNEVRLGFGFCRQCRQCLVSCPHDADIPTLMRTHMYASQYSDFYLARTTLEEIPQAKSISACADCSNCVARCAHQSVDIAARVADLKLMYA